MNLNSAIPSLLQSALNTFLGLDSDAAESLNSISGKIIQLKVTGLGLNIYVLPLGNRVNVQSFDPGTIDTSISGTPAGYIRQSMVALSGKATSGNVDIQGDIETGVIFQKVLSQVEFDWEEALAQRLGDIPAHQIGNLLRGLAGWFAHASDSTRQDTSEYLQEESRLTPGRIEQEYFLSESDTLRSDIDRLEARLRRLESRLLNSVT